MNNCEGIMLGSSTVDVPDLLGSVHPFMKANQSFLHILLSEVTGLLRDKQAHKILWYLLLNFLCTVMLFIWCNATNSMALTAYTYLTIFEMFSLLTCLVTLWVTKQRPSPIFSFGYERFEVLAVFASTVLAQFGALFIVKESVERMLMQPDVHTGRLLVGTAVAFLFHVLVTYSIDKRAFNDVTSASSSSWLQEHVTDISESLCHVVPGLAKLLLPRINPIALIACAGAMALVVTHVLIDMYNYYSIDTWAAVWIALMTCGTMFPMSVYSGKILLQTTPSHSIGQLDKCLREASTLDGVLEFRHEHFWTVAFGTMAGSVHVRVRRDADEQMVLAHVYHRLSNLISVLTVQIFKDDWSRPSVFQILGDSSLAAKTDKPTTIGSIDMGRTVGTSSYAAASSSLQPSGYGQQFISPQYNRITGGYGGQQITGTLPTMPSSGHDHIHVDRYTEAYSQSPYLSSSGVNIPYASRFSLPSQGLALDNTEVPVLGAAPAVAGTLLQSRTVASASTLGTGYTNTVLATFTGADACEHGAKNK